MGSNKEVIETIIQDIKDLNRTKFSYTKTGAVPSLNESSLTFGTGGEKKAKIIETCVLFVDIRDSVKLTLKHTAEEMGKIYTSLTNAVLRAADNHNGIVRNIIGDRVMLVFPSLDCITNSINCAITINHAAKEINKVFTSIDFKCGIGIDYGELKVIKVGIPKRNDERDENRGFVWVGKPANIASRLTDAANKTLTNEVYKVTKEKFQPLDWSHLLGHKPKGLLGAFGTSSPLSEVPTTEEMTGEKFADSLHNPVDGKISLMLDKFIRFKKEKKEIHYPAILITDNVYVQMNNDKTKTFFTEISHKIKDVKSKVYGANLHWEF